MVDEDYVCRRCLSMYTPRDGGEPSTYCDPCAQEVLTEMEATQKQLRDTMWLLGKCVQGDTVDPKALNDAMKMWAEEDDRRGAEQLDDFSPAHQRMTVEDMVHAVCVAVKHTDTIVDRPPLYLSPDLYEELWRQCQVQGGTINPLAQTIHLDTSLPPHSIRWG